MTKYNEINLIEKYNVIAICCNIGLVNTNHCFLCSEVFGHAAVKVETWNDDGVSQGHSLLESHNAVNNEWHFLCITADNSNE